MDTVKVKFDLLDLFSNLIKQMSSIYSRRGRATEKVLFLFSCWLLRF